MAKKASTKKKSSQKKEPSSAPSFNKKEITPTVPQTKHSQKKDEKVSVSIVGSVDNNKKQHIAEQLEEIYKNPDGTLPDMSSFVTGENSRFVRAFVFMLFSLCLFGLVFWFGVVQHAPKDSFSQNNVILSISGEDEVVIGEAVRYRVRYRNDQDTILKQTHLTVRFPEGFVYEHASVPPESDTSGIWNLGALEAYDSGYIDIFGTIYGDEHQEQSARVFLTYTPENFSSEFQSVAKTEFTTMNPDIMFSVDGATEVVPGAETTLTIRLSGMGEYIGGSRALVVDGDGVFVKKFSDKESEQFHELRWAIPNDSEEFDVTVRGVFLSPNEGESSLSLPVRYVVSGAEHDTEYTFSQTTFDTGIVKKDIILTSIVNGTTQDIELQPGDILHASVVLKNSSTKSLRRVRARAVLDAPSFNNKSILHWPALADPLDGDVVGEQLSQTQRRGSITWTEDMLPALAVIAPGETVTIDFSVPIRHKEQAILSDFAEHVGTMTVEMQYTGEDGVEVFSGEPLSFTINSDLSFRSELVTKDDAEDVSEVRWIIENSFHELQDITIFSEIYGDVSVPTSTMIVPAGNVLFDKETKRFTWEIETMPVAVDILPLQFSVMRHTINPSQTQLMSKIELRATDAVTGEEILLLGDEILL